jgi:chromosome segregation ATPase
VPKSIDNGVVRSINLTQCRLSDKQTNTVAALAAAQTAMGQTTQLVNQVQVLTDIVSEQRDYIVAKRHTIHLLQKNRNYYKMENSANKSAWQDEIMDRQDAEEALAATRATLSTTIGNATNEISMLYGEIANAKSVGRGKTRMIVDLERMNAAKDGAIAEYKEEIRILNSGGKETHGVEDLKKELMESKKRVRELEESTEVIGKSWKGAAKKYKADTADMIKKWKAISKVANGAIAQAEEE